MKVESVFPQEYRQSSDRDRAVSPLDPLRADDFFREHLPQLNRGGDPRLIAASFAPLLPSRETVARLGVLEAMAATRDIAMVASSLTRWGAQVHDFPDIEEALLGLSRITDEVPADTVTTYGPRNPEGERRRTFTATEGERFFIDSFTQGMQSLSLSVATVDAAQDVQPTDPLWAELLGAAEVHLSGMMTAMVAVARNITPEFFTHQLRPYFEPKIIGGKKYFAPGGAQMPLVLLDLALWGVEDNDPQYVRYWNENVGYLPVLLRGRTAKILRVGSLVACAEREILQTTDSDVRRVLGNGLRSLRTLLQAVDRFRSPHLSVAEANMRLRKQGSVGSGGYDTHILELLIGRVREARKAVDTLLTSIET